MSSMPFVSSRIRGASALTALLVALPACSQTTDLTRRQVPPDVQILQPTRDATVSAGASPLQLLGTTEDNLDGPEMLSASWELNGDTFTATIDAEGGVQGNIDPGFVTPGLQRLTLYVTDSDGAVGSDQVSFTIEPVVSAPEVSILSPEDGDAFALGAAIEFEGIADDEGTAADQLIFRWLSDRDGVLTGAATADGRSVLTTSDLTAGNHFITLEVTDTDGDIGVDQIEIAVQPEEAQPGDLVFSEMMINPQVVEDEVGEWVELYNTSGREIDITGYSFHDDDVDIYVLGGPLRVAGGDYLVLCANMDPLTNGGVPCDGFFARVSEGGGLALANVPDEVVLSRPDGVEIDWLHYDQSWYTPGVAIGVDPMFMNSGANDDVSHWCEQTTVISTGGEPGTPGQPNDPC